MLNNLTRFFKFSSILTPVVIAIMALLFTSYYTISQGERGVLLRFGKVIGISDPGFHLKLPFVDSVEKMSVRNVKSTKEIDIYSKDIQAAKVKISVNTELNPASVEQIYTTVGDQERYFNKIITPRILSTPKDVFGKYNAVNIVQAREKLSREIQEEMQKQLGPLGISVLSVQIENIDFSDSYEHSVEERMKAEVEVQKVQQNLEREKINADMLRTRAKGEADAKLATATAEAKAIEIRGKAEAEAISAKAKAMRENPDYIKMLEAERWDGKLPTTMLPNSSLPIIK